MVIVSHPTGNANVSAVVTALEEQDLLTAFFTCIVWRPESTMAKLMPGSLRAMFQRRARVQLRPELVRTRPSRELIRNLLIRAGKKHLIASESHPFSIDGVYRDLDKFVARNLRKYPQAKAVYAYDGRSAASLPRGAQARQALYLMTYPSVIGGQIERYQSKKRS